MPKNYIKPEKIKLEASDVLNEMSYTILPTQLTINPYNPDDLIVKKGLYTYDKMKDDEVVKIALLVKKTIMLSNNILVEPSSQSPIDIKIADFITYNLFDRLKTPFNRRLESMLSALDYGYSVSEIMYAYINNHKDFKGLIGVDDLKTRPPHGFDFKTDACGNLAYLKQYQGQGMYSLDLPPSKFAIHTFDKQFDNLYGNADLRAIYRPWWIKDVTLKFYAMHLERYGTPLLIAYYTGQLTADEEKDLKAILKYLLKGTGFKLPDGKVRIDNITFPAPAGYSEALDRCDKMMSRGLLMPDNLGFTNTNVGSYALGMEQFNLFYVILKRFLDNLLEDINIQVIKRLVDINFPNVDKYPKLKASSLQVDELDKLSNVYATLTTSGYMTPQNEKDLNFVRDKYNLPKNDSNEILHLTDTNINKLFETAKNYDKKYDIAKLNDFVTAEKELQKQIEESIKNVSIEEYEKMIDAFKDRDFEKMEEIIKKTNEESLKTAINDVMEARFNIGKESI